MVDDTVKTLSYFMKRLHHLKSLIFSFAVTWLLLPATTFAFSPEYISPSVDKDNSVGQVFTTYFLEFTTIYTEIQVFSLILFVITLLIPGLILGLLFHRKYAVYIFLVFFSLSSLNTIVSIGGNAKLSDMLANDIIVFYALVSLTITIFIVASFSNERLYEKEELSDKDYIPFGILVGIAIFLMLLPIRSGHVVCKTPFLKNEFNCEKYLQEDAQEEKGWFTVEKRTDR